MPPHGALLQRFVVAVLVLLDRSLNADVSTHFVAELIELKEQNESGYAPVAVPEWVDTQKVEV
ncbi:MAG: hypothetical protein ACOC6C_00900 [Verrucomicrobiota bacterium]